MASGNAGQVTLRGRFPVGAVVTLTKVRDERVLRPEGGEEIETQTVGEEDGAPRVGFVRFSKRVEVGGRYFISGLVDGHPLNIRATGKAADDPDAGFAQAPIMPDRTRFSDGSFVDSAPTKESAPHILAAQADIRHAKKGMVLRSDTARGEAHPVDVEAQEPTRRQEDVNGPVQASDTPHGEATELVIGAQRQEDVPKGVLQRSSTPSGVAAPFPVGDAVRQAEDRESGLARESRGEPGRASAEPLDAKGVKSGAPSGSTKKASDERHEELRKSENEAIGVGGVPSGTSAGPDQPAVAHEDRSGFDAQGQPAAEDVARAAGVEPPKKIRVDSPGPDTAASIKDRFSGDAPESDEPDAVRVEAGKKAAKTRKRNEKKAAKEPVQKPEPDQGSKSSGPTTGAATTSNTTAKE